MNSRGLYVAPGQWLEDGEVRGEPPENATISFWASGLASPFVSWGTRIGNGGGKLDHGSGGIGPLRAE